MLTEQEIQFALANIHRLTADEQTRLLSVLEELERRKHFANIWTHRMSSLPTTNDLRNC